MRTFKQFILWGLVISFAVLMGACAHPINISPTSTPKRDEARLINKRVAYVITEELRNKTVTTDGGGGDKITYNPYRDLEKSIRDALRAVYTDVKAISSTEGHAEDTDLIFNPVLTTSSSSDSVMTWPPTKFFVNLECAVTNSQGTEIVTLRVNSFGNAEFSEFTADFGLAGRRAASNFSSKLQEEIRNTPSLQ